MSPPPPPPYSASFGGIYDSAIFGHRKNSWIFRIGSAIFFLGLLVFGAGVACVVKCSHCPHYTGVWVGISFTICGIVGIVTAYRGGKAMLIVNLLISIGALVAAIVLVTLCIIRMIAAGSQYVNLKCLIYEYDPDSIRFMYEKMGSYDFKGCVHGIVDDLKVGIAMNTLLIVLGAEEVMVIQVLTINCFCQPVKTRPVPVNFDEKRINQLLDSPNFKLGMVKVRSSMSGIRSSDRQPMSTLWDRSDRAKKVGAPGSENYRTF